MKNLSETKEKGKVHASPAPRVVIHYAVVVALILAVLPSVLKWLGIG